MRNVLLTITLLITNAIAFSQTEWAYQTGGDFSFFTDADAACSIDVDAEGNSYVTGYFNGDSDFDNTIDVDLHSSIGQTDVFVIKLNSQGGLIWAKTFGSASDDYGYSIKVDEQGNVFVAGVFTLNADFDPGDLIEMKTSHGSYDIFLLKLDANGNFVWVNTFGGTYSDNCKSIVLDENSNIYLAGSFQHNVDFDQSADIEEHSGQGAFDVFVMKINENGSFNWVKTIGSTLYDRANSIDIDSDNNLYITGEFCDTVDFDPGSAEFVMIAEASSNAFVLKLDSLGAFVWSESFNSNVVSVGYSISVSDLGEVFMAGSYQGELDYDPGVDSVLTISNGGWDVFAISLDQNGNYMWGKSMGSTEGDKVNSIFFDPNSMKVYVTGYFKLSADFNPEQEEFILSSLSSTAVFMLKLDINGEFDWAKTITNQDAYSAGIEITTDDFGNIYLVGAFGGTLNFGMDQTSFMMTSVEANDAYVIKLGNTTEIEDEQQKSFLVYPNPFNNVVIIEHDYFNSMNGSIINTQGKVLSSFQTTNGKASLDLINLPQGIYFVKMNESDKTIKLIKN